MALQFYQQRVTFSDQNESADGTVQKTISKQFNTDIKDGSATIQGFKFNYKNYDHNFYTALATISNSQIQGDTITCDVVIQLTDKSRNTLDPASVFVDVLFIVDCN